MLVPINKFFLSKRWCCFFFIVFFFFLLFYFVRPRKDRVCFNYLPYQMILDNTSFLAKTRKRCNKKTS